MAVHLSILPAAAAPVAVIFRRGPTKQVRQILWHVDTDRFEAGQWLAGRVYAPRCDVSPDGRLLVYFAMRRGHTWNAVCRPPHFTPLAVWEEPGTWGGGGRFSSNRRLLLRANPACLQLDPKYTLPDRFTLGWLAGEAVADVPPRSWGICGPHPQDETLCLQTSPAPFVDPHGPRGRLDARVVDHRRDRVHAIDGVDWCGWGPTGDLLFARDGGLWRVRWPLAHRDLDEIDRTARLLADFSDDGFRGVPPTPDALIWPPGVESP